MDRRLLFVVLGVAGLAFAVWFLLSRQPAPEPPPPAPLPLLEQIPRAYSAAAEGTIALGDNAVPGRVRANYLVYPDQRVVITHLAVWMDDLDLVVPFLWWETREPLRCTIFRNDGAIEGTLQDGELVIPAGTKVLGQSYRERDPSGGCRGKLRLLDTRSTDVLRVTHDPEGNHFGVSASFETSYQDHELTVTLEAQGRYLNRPPVAKLQVMEDVPVLPDGCPEKKILANTPEGLQVRFRSTSYDLDGIWPGVEGEKLRVDLSFEQWARSRPDGFVFLGAGRDIGPVLFETGREHQLLLWITDRQGAEGRKLCHFQVEPPG
ncbi:MAG: hypothetical protein O7I93_17305 [Gemmatimonadetes bacterium]|nr:hypothetical protein [Gemmatimonadota bacterium]